MNQEHQSGLLIAAPASGSGKTVITLGLLRALANAGVDIVGAKAGPDYIDPAFHAVASAGTSLNLDPWAMHPDRLRALAAAGSRSHLLVEGMMGLFDGAADGSGSPAQLAKILGIPVLLVVDVARQSHSVAAIVRGFRDHDKDVSLAGVILNRVGSERHETMLRYALDQIDINVLGAVYRNSSLSLPERHLGLVQAGETEGIETFLQNAAETVSRYCDMEQLLNSFGRIAPARTKTSEVPPPGQRIAIAQDEAFSFCYPHLVLDWQRAGAQLSFFSPLSDQGPATDADAVFLPGGYPELHGGKLASAENFKSELAKSASRGALVYGECGGYMVLGEGLVDANGTRHSMTGLLKLETSFKERKLHLGYRQISAKNFVFGERLKGHEFHYSCVVKQEGDPLFETCDALGAETKEAGLRSGNVMGSYIHVIDRTDP